MFGYGSVCADFEAGEKPCNGEDFYCLPCTQPAGPDPSSNPQQLQANICQYLLELEAYRTCLGETKEAEMLGQEAIDCLSAEKDGAL
jgi:hypothetical protein